MRRDAFLIELVCLACSMTCIGRTSVLPTLGFGDLDRYSGEIVKFFKGSLVRSAVMSSCRPETVPSLYGHADVLLNAPTKYYQES